MTFAIDLDIVAHLDRGRPWHGVTLPNPAFSLREQPRAVLLAMLLWGEARSEGALGMLMCGCVVRNRVLLAPRYGTGWHGVMLRWKQFSCFNVGDPNSEKARYPLHHDSTAVWDRACNSAHDIMENRCGDLTGGATHYATRTQPPWWAGPTITRTVEYGEHVFYSEA